MNIYKTPTRRIDIIDDELIFSTRIGLWTMVGLMLTIIGGTLTIILQKTNAQLTGWQILFFIVLLLGANFLLGKKKVIIRKGSYDLTRTISTILLKFTKNLTLNEYNEICVYGGHSSFAVLTEGRVYPVKSTGAVQIGLKKDSYYNIFELADFYDKEGPKVFTEALAKHIGWELPATMLVAGEEKPLKWE
jgi:hypothetical protein